MEEKIILSKEMIKASEEMFNYLLNQLSTENGIPMGEFLSTTGRIAGASLFRAFNPKIKDAEPGTFIESEEANMEWSKLDSLLRSLLRSRKIVIKDTTSDIPENLVPQLSTLDVFTKYLDDSYQIKDKYKLDFRTFSYVGTLTCATIIYEFKEHLDPDLSAAIAVRGFIEGTKTTPPI